MGKIELIFDKLKTNEGQEKTTFQIKTLQNKLHDLINIDYCYLWTCNI